MQKTRLSSDVTVERYKELEKDNDRQGLAQFVRDRFHERYFRPIESTPETDQHGFTIMAVCCLVIETLESYYQGRGSTRYCSGQMFSDFFARDTALKVFAGANNWFYDHIRCGILHQSEARGGWRIRRKGPLLDTATKQINAAAFMQELRKAVDAYADQLEHDNDLLDRFKKKMQTVCANCA